MVQALVVVVVVVVVVCNLEEGQPCLCEPTNVFITLPSKL
jgi:hypothetical protein